MVDILIQPPELRRISEQLRTSAQKIAAAMQAIDDAISSLKGDKFLGNRSNKVQANYAPKREALLTAKNIILHFAEDLKNTANIFEKADFAGVEKKGISAFQLSYIVEVPPRNYALFSRLAYSDSPDLPDELKKHGWEFLCDTNDFGLNKDGYFSAVFVNPRTGEVVIAHRGTDQWNFNPLNRKSSDVDDDLNIGLGRIPDQYWVSRQFVDQVKEKLSYDSRFSDYSLVHTGHSLGGALSDLNALADGSKGISFDGPGTLGIIKNHQDIFSPDGRVNLISYKSNPDFVNQAGQQAGYSVQIIPKEGGDINPIARVHPVIELSAKFEKTKTHHSLDNIVQSMSPETGYPIGYFPPQANGGNHGYHNLDELNQGKVGGTANACYIPPPLPKI